MMGSEGTLSCDDVNARLLDLVYGEGSAGERQALQAHVGGCARCTADLEALGWTRAVVRERLDEAPPVAARARILKAAAAAVAPPPKSKPAAAAAAGPWWQRLRLRWTLPTLATVGAVTLMLLASRVLLNPRGTYERGRQGLSAEPATAPATAPVVVPTAEPPPAPPGAGAPAPEAKAAPVANADRLRGIARAHRKAPSGGLRDAAAAKASSPTMDQVIQESARSRAFAQPPPAVEKAPAPMPRKGNLDDLLEGASSKSSGGGKGRGVGAAAPPPAARPAKRPVMDVDPLEGFGSSGAAAAPAAAPAEAEKELDEERSDKKAKRADKAEKPAAGSPEAMARRADQLYAEQRWSEALAAYQELLRRYPSADGAPRWRARVAEAREAMAAAPATATRKAKAAPASSSESQ